MAPAAEIAGEEARRGRYAHLLTTELTDKLVGPARAERFDDGVAGPVFPPRDVKQAAAERQQQIRGLIQAEPVHEQPHVSGNPRRPRLPAPVLPLDFHRAGR